MTALSLFGDFEIFLQEEKEVIYMSLSEATPLCSNHITSCWEISPKGHSSQKYKDDA